MPGFQLRASWRLSKRCDCITATMSLQPANCNEGTASCLEVLRPAVVHIPSWSLACKQTAAH
jgi:hypothetical protein